MNDPHEVIQQKVGPHNETVCRTVHYVNLGDKDGKYPPSIIAAIITAVNENGTVALKCLYPTGVFDCPEIPYSETYKRGHWSWPPRV